VKEKLTREDFYSLWSYHASLCTAIFFYRKSSKSGSNSEILHVLEGLQYNYLPSILNQILLSFYATAKNIFGRIMI